MNKLILFTSSFPFGNKETYIERELDFLSEAFETVEIYPHYYNQGNKTQRIVPKNVKVHKAALPIQKIKRFFQSLKGLFKGAKVGFFIKEFFSKKVYNSKANFKNWLITLIDYMATVGSIQYNTIKEKKNTVFYFYWGFGWSYVILNFERAKSCKTYIRLHGSEVYLERSNGYIPLRKELFEKSNFLLPISKDLSQYLQKCYGLSSGKIKVSRLGIKLQKMISEENKSRKYDLHLVSCSNMIKLKRISKIIKALKFLDDKKVKWDHFGDGPEKENLVNQVNNANFKNINVNFFGSVSNKLILEHYKRNYIDVFINVSKYEGIPVSAMEAMSFGIPCIATNVGATKELVNNNTGVLLEVDFNIEDLVDGIKLFLNKNFFLNKRISAYNHCKKEFTASINYTELTKLLKQ